MKIYFVRHGETNYNVLDLCNDDPSKDVHLTERGQQQSERLAQQMKNIQFDAIIVSELSRTRETAEIINKTHAAPVFVDPRINDRKTGFDSKPVPDFFAAVEAASDKWSAKFNNGESFLEEKARVIDFLRGLPDRGYQSLLVITHSEVMKIIFGYYHKFSNEKMWEVQIDNTQVLDFEM